MKKLLVLSLGILVLLITIYAVKPVSAVITPNVITALNASTYTAISTDHNSHCRPITVWTSDGSAFWVASVVDGTDGVLIPADSSYSNSCVTDTSGVMLYSKSSAGTPNLYMAVGLPK